MTERVSEVLGARRKPAKRAMSKADERRLLVALRRGDEDAYHGLIADHHLALVRLALPYVRDSAVAEEVAQETWVAFHRGLDGFEHRSSLRTWLFGILLKRARSIGEREGRCTPLSRLSEEIGEASEDPLERLFHGDDHPDRGGWAVPPSRWRVSPEDELLASEIRRRIEQVSRGLPEAQRVVFTLKDTQGWDTREIADLLGQTRNWVRVVLHRARLKLREELEEHLGGVES